jgi:hypothetical protein
MQRLNNRSQPEQAEPSSSVAPSVEYGPLASADKKAAGIYALRLAGILKIDYL